MKAVLFFFLVSCSFINSSKAQNIYAGIKGGYNLYNIHDDNGAKYDNLSGFHAGLLAHIHVSHHFSLQPEVVYSAQGAKYTVLGETVKLKLGYVNVPVLAQILFGKGFRLELGPQIGFLVTGERVDPLGTTNVKSSLKSTDLSLVGGLGYISPGGVGFDVRYNWGFTDINDNNSSKSMNRGLQAGIFFQFGHKL